MKRYAKHFPFLMTDILNHLLSLDAVRYTLMKEAFIPTCELTSVEGTLMDFRQPNQRWPESNAFLQSGETYRNHTKFRFL